MGIELSILGVYRTSLPGTVVLVHSRPNWVIASGVAVPRVVVTGTVILRVAIGKVGVLGVVVAGVSIPEVAVYVCTRMFVQRVTISEEGAPI